MTLNLYNYLGQIPQEGLSKKDLEGIRIQVKQEKKPGVELVDLQLKRLVDYFDTVDEDKNGFLSKKEFTKLSKMGDGNERDISIEDLNALEKQALKEPLKPEPKVQEKPVPPVQSQLPSFMKDSSTKVVSTKGGSSPPTNFNFPELVEVIIPPKEPVYYLPDTRINPRMRGQDPIAIKVYKPYLTEAEKDEIGIAFEVDRSDMFGAGRTSGKPVAKWLNEVIAQRAGIRSMTKHEYEGKTFASQHAIEFRNPGIFVVKGKMIVVEGEIRVRDSGTSKYADIKIEEQGGVAVETTTYNKDKPNKKVIKRITNDGQNFKKIFEEEEGIRKYSTGVTITTEEDEKEITTPSGVNYVEKNGTKDFHILGYMYRISPNGKQEIKEPNKEWKETNGIVLEKIDNVFYAKLPGGATYLIIDGNELYKGPNGEEGYLDKGKFIQGKWPRELKALLKGLEKLEKNPIRPAPPQGSSDTRTKAA